MRLPAARAAAAAALLAACSGPAPSATPGGFSEVVSALVLSGVAVHEQVSGDDGCARVDLHDNAMRLSVSVSGDTARHDVYLFRWRRAPDFAASIQDFFMCVADFRSNNPGVVIQVAEQSPWRAYGPDWPASLKAAIDDAIRTSAGG